MLSVLAGAGALPAVCAVRESTSDGNALPGAPIRELADRGRSEPPVAVDTGTLAAGVKFVALEGTVVVVTTMVLDAAAWLSTFC